MDRGEHVADVHVGEDPPEFLVGARARDEPLEPRPPRDEALVGSDRRRLQREVLPGAHLANEPFEEHPLFFRGLAVRESRRRHRLRDGRVQDEGSRTVRMGRREQHRHRRRTSSTEHDRVRRSGGVHHGADVIALQLEHGGLGPSVGESHTPHVEEDQPGELRQTLKEVGPSRLLPHQLHVRPDAARVDEVDRTVADHLVRDGGSIRRLRVAGLGDLHGRIFGSRTSGPQPARSATGLRTVAAVGCLPACLPSPMVPHPRGGSSARWSLPLQRSRCWRARWGAPPPPPGRSSMPPRTA